MSMGGGGYMSGGRMPAPAADYKLFRFYDFDVVPEKRYKYRVKLYVRDPNHPQAPMPAPPVAYLEDDVVARIKKLDAEDAKKTQETGQLHQTYWVETEWSDWSPAGEVPPQYEIAAGPATPARTTVVQTVEVRDPGEEPEASVLALVFDKAKGADVPGLLPATRGSVLNFTGPANALHPVNMQVLPLGDYDFKTDVLVLDVRGGQQLPTTDKANIDHKAPGEVLLMDSEGALVVHNELDDIAEFSNNIFKEPEKPKVVTPDASEGYYPAYGGAGGKPKRGRGPGSGS
jgi:hypothetical protein